MTNIQSLPDSLRMPPHLELTEDQLSDLLWLVENYGHKLTEAMDYITPANVAGLARVLEAKMEGMG
jgi:hypothetical protein